MEPLTVRHDRGTVMTGLRIIEKRDDDMTDIFLDGTRIGYVENDWLHLIGADGYATAICEIRDKEDIGKAVAAHRG